MGLLPKVHPLWLGLSVGQVDLKSIYNIFFHLVQLHIISLTGGGFALAEGSRVSGMAKMLGESLAFAGEMHSVLVISMCIIISLFCTAFASNVAICNILIPIFSEMVC